MPENPIDTFHYNTMYVGMHKLCIEKQGPDCMHKVTLAMSKHCSCSRLSKFCTVRILDCINELPIINFNSGTEEDQANTLLECMLDDEQQKKLASHGYILTGCQRTCKSARVTHFQSLSGASNLTKA